MAFGRGRGDRGRLVRGRGRGMGWQQSATGRSAGNYSSSSSRGRGGASVRGRGRPQHQQTTQQEHHKPSVKHLDSDDDDENAPPVAQSARRAQDSDSDAEGEVTAPRRAMPPHGKQRPSQQQQQQQRRPQMQRQVRTSDGNGTQQEGKSSAAAARLPAVATVLTANQTELPQKLNTKIFIDGLPYTHQAEPGKPTLEQELIDFAAAWKVGKALRLIKKPGQGFGFLVFKSPHSVPLAVRFLNGRQFLGRALRVEEPKPRDLAQMQDAANTKAGSGKESFQRQVLISDLAKVTQPEIIREVLRDVAPQLEKKLEAIKMTSRNRKAFLTFATPEDVSPALRFLDGFHLLGRRISATAAAPPGALPYSHPHSVAVAQKQSLVPSTTTDKLAPVKSTSDDDTEVAVVPLGLKPESSSTRAQRREVLRKLTSATAAEPAEQPVRSNVTGRTEKYNLLDDGPADIYVGNLTEAITESQLREHFAPCGTITRCELLAHPETHLATGIAHIVFSLPAYAAYAQAHYHGSQLRGCVLRVDRGDSASPALVSETGAVNAAHDDEEVYDEDAFLARRGITNKEAYFKNTSVAADMSSSSSADKTRPMKRARTAAKEDTKDEAAKPSKKAKKNTTQIIDDDDNDVGEENDVEKDADLALAGLLGSDDDEEEERFYDVDAMPQQTVTTTTKATVKAKKDARGKKAKGKGLDKKTRKQPAHAKSAKRA